MLPVSIVMPVYNSAEFIKDCIESIFNQSFQDFELIVVNDGSTDNTLEILSEYDDTRLKILNNNNDFINSLNKGVSESKGKYLVRMDADDIMLPNRLRVQYNFMEENNQIDVCGSWIEFFGSKKGIHKYLSSHNQILSALILYNPLCHPSIIMKRKLINEFPSKCLYNPRYLYAEDYKLWTDLALKECCFATIQEVLVKYRVSEKQVTSLHKDKMIKMSLMIQQEFIKDILKLLENKNMQLIKIIAEINYLYKNNYINHSCLQKLTYSLYSDFL